MISNVLKFIGSVCVIRTDELQVEHGSIIKGDHMQIPFKLAANL